jgi:hypothetical protein
MPHAPCAEIAVPWEMSSDESLGGAAGHRPRAADEQRTTGGLVHHNAHPSTLCPGRQPACARANDWGTPGRALNRHQGWHRAGVHRSAVIHLLLIGCGMLYVPGATHAEVTWTSGSGIGVQCDMLLPPFNFQFGPGYERCSEIR